LGTESGFRVLGAISRIVGNGDEIAQIKKDDNWAGRSRAGSKSKESSSISLQYYTVRFFAFIAVIASLALFVIGSVSGAAMLYQEALARNSPLFDHDGYALAEFMLKHTRPDAVVMHSNGHTQPSFSLAGRPSLVAYCMFYI
jgi:hypothetical protein